MSFRPSSTCFLQSPSPCPLYPCRSVPSPLEWGCQGLSAYYYSPLCVLWVQLSLQLSPQGRQSTGSSNNVCSQVSCIPVSTISFPRLYNTSCCSDVFLHHCILMLHMQICMEVGVWQTCWWSFRWWSMEVWKYGMHCVQPGADCWPLVLTNDDHVMSFMMCLPKPPMTATVRWRHSIAYLTWTMNFYASHCPMNQ